MASICILFAFTVFYFSAGNAGSAFITVKCKTEQTAQYGENALLECEIQPSKDVENMQVNVVTWKKVGLDEPLMVFHYGEMNRNNPRYSFAEPSWNNRNRNVSLLITNTAVKDEGEYTCWVLTSSGDLKDPIVTRLHVTAKYNAPTIKQFPETLNQDSDGSLVCSSSGGYPEGQLRWFDEDGADWTRSSEMVPELTRQTESGLFELTSRLNLQRKSVFPKYTCRVFNATGGKEGEAEFSVPDAPVVGERTGMDSTGASKVVAPVVVIGSLIVGLLVLLLIRRRRAQQARRSSTAPLMGGHQEVSQCELGGKDDDHNEMDTTRQGDLA